MDRRDFIKKGCTACLSVTAISLLASSCISTKYTPGKLAKDGISLLKEDFIIQQRGGKAYSSFIIVRNDALKFPICVYRTSDNEYTALWMRCTHQGAELQASGDVLQCSAHGSEFTSKGAVRTGPADTALRTFPVTVSNNEIFIDLRKPS
jgi:Rieske Fe-S protein